MIKIKNRRMIIPECDRRIAMRGDAMANVLTFAVPTSEVGGIFGEDDVSAYLKLAIPEAGDGNCVGERDVADKKAIPIALMPGGECDGCYVWKWHITADITAVPGYIPAQLCLCHGASVASASVASASVAEANVANAEDGAVIWNSEIGYFYTGESLGVKEYEPSSAEISAIEALLISVGGEADRAVKAKEQAEEFCSIAEDASERADETMRSAVLSSGSASDSAERAKTSADEAKLNADSASESFGRIVMLEGGMNASAEAAGKSRDEAKQYAENAKLYADNAKAESDGVAVAKAEIVRYADEVLSAKETAEAVVRDGKEYAENAKASADEARANSSLSLAYSENADVYCERARGYAESASERAVHAGSQAEEARSFAENAELYADEAKRHADRAEEATGANINLDGYVKVTDYATNEVGGVIKVAGGGSASVFPGRTSSGYLSVSDDGVLQLTSAYPYEVTSESGSQAPLTCDLKYAVSAEGTHKQMSDGYDVESKHCVNLGSRSKGDLPASYNAVKNYVDGEVGGLYEDADCAITDFETEVVSDYPDDVMISESSIGGMSGKVTVKCRGEVITMSFTMSGSTTLKYNGYTYSSSDSFCSTYGEEMESDIEINLGMGSVDFADFKVRRFKNTLAPFQVKNAISAEVSPIDAKISEKVGEDIIFGGEEEFLWTDFTCDYDESKCTVGGNEISISEWNSPVTVHCKGRTLGFYLTCYEPCTVTVNGVNVIDNTSAWGFELPMTKMESDIVFAGSASNLRFGSMRCKAVGGAIGKFVEKKVSELSLGVAEDGLIYLFVGGEPQGTGIDTAGFQ